MSEVSHLCRLSQVVQVTEKQLFSRNAWQDWHLPAEVLVFIPHSTYLKSCISSSCGGRQGSNKKELISFKTQTHEKGLISQQDGSARAAEEAKWDPSASPITYLGSTAQCKRPQNFVGTEWGEQEWMRCCCLEIRTCKDACRTGLLLHSTPGNTQTKSEIKWAVRSVFKDSDLPKLLGCKVRSPQNLSPLALLLLKFSLTNLPLLPLSSLTK